MALHLWTVPLGRLSDHQLDHQDHRGRAEALRISRYFFTNKSDDIRKLCSETLTKVGVEWTTLARGSEPFNISVARRASVSLMDKHVGPKY
ncbi:hypothetical protein SANT12839_028730 [Streptomyces antimycoticus]|uniref:Uncharacterized protein n=1 Tax=Streptomyces antimycoticus TaxID=68175 RepID=A0A4D4JYV2_9ACTN|nr:hypothetical protein SANT12839_028730 [Streptomyces antimycoticus]